VVSARGEEITHAVAATIKQIRTERGWSQERLADEADLHRTFIGLVEAGNRGLSVAAADGIARAFEMKLSELLRQAEMSL
jgi:transcriptional regulator with XRE-family HTH domain